MTELTPLSSAPLSDQAYDAVRAAILRGELKPGQKVTERGLAEALGVSPTPVREALQRLVHDGRIERAGARTLRIAEFDTVALAEIDEIEIEMQVLVARFAARKASEAQHRAMREALDEADRSAAALEEEERAGEEFDESSLLGVFESLRRFHELLEAAAGNSVLDRIVQQARAFSSEERRDAGTRMRTATADGVRARYGDHRALLSAIAAHDEEAAAAIARAHATSSHRELRHRS